MIGPASTNSTVKLYSWIEFGGHTANDKIA
jgi:hypothetical protein